MVAAEPLLEEDKEEEWRGSFLAGGLVPLQAPVPEVGPSVGPRFHSGQGTWQGLPASEKAQGKAPAVEPPPPEMDEELARWLQQEEIAV